MDAARLLQDEDPFIGRLGGDEPVHSVVRGLDATRLVVTDRRVAVAEDARIALDVGFDNVRRIQFDIERQRPGSLVIVPEDPRYEPQVLAIPPEQYDAVGSALAHVGRRIFSEVTPGRSGGGGDDRIRTGE